MDFALNTESQMRYHFIHFVLLLNRRWIDHCDGMAWVRMLVYFYGLTLFFIFSLVFSKSFSSASYYLFLSSWTRCLLLRFSITNSTLRKAWLIGDNKWLVLENRRRKKQKLVKHTQTPRSISDLNVLRNVFLVFNQKHKLLS